MAALIFDPPKRNEPPADWASRSLRSILKPRAERNQPDLPLLTVARERGVFVRTADDDNHNAIPEDLSSYKVALRGDLVINKMKAWQGSLGLAPVDGIVSPAYFVFQADFAVPQFGEYLLRSKPLVAKLGAASDGVRVGQWDLNISRMRGISVGLPPADEQAAIVKYLAHANARIDKAIAAKRHLIALLEEQKRAAIAEGMRSTTEGNRELRHVLRRLVDCEHKTAPFVEGTCWWILRTSAVKAGAIQWEGAYTTDEGSYRVWTSRAVPEPGDVIFTREAPVGEAAVIPSDRAVALGQRTVLMKLRREVMDPQYLVYQIYGGLPRERIALATQGSTVGHFNMDDIGWMRVAVPSLERQRRLVAAVQAINASADRVLDRVRREIALLAEFRTRLVADAVTGQVDVRAVAAALPEAVGEAVGLRAGAESDCLDIGDVMEASGD